MFANLLFPLRAALSCSALLLLTSAPALQAQNLEMTPTPFTSVIDFEQLRHPAGKTLESARSQPIWLESVQLAEGESDKDSKTTTFRIRLRSLPGLTDTLLLRLFFQDKPDLQPVITGWSETGDRRYASPPLGAGLNLLASESLVIPTRGIDYLEIAVPGDGSSLRQALMTILRKKETLASYDFEPERSVSDPFEGSEGLSPLPPENDAYLFGRTRATLEPGTLKLVAPEDESSESHTVHFEFDLSNTPLLAMVTFQVLGADPAEPLLAWANGDPVGTVAMQLPDLADPGYSGVSRPLERMHFRYAGWVRGHKVIPAKSLRSGKNTFTLQLPPHSAPVALRKIELQVKNHWQKLDYTLIPF